jgi:predicted aconitase
MLELESVDRSLLNGEFGAGAAHAMALLVQYGEAMRADRFISIVSAHIDGCLYHGPSSIDFAKRFADLGARVLVPTTLNVAAIDTLHSDWYGAAAALVAPQIRLNTLHVELGCTPTLTCAPYQRIPRPRLGEHVAWAESNAIVFVNSVLGARTDRYGDFTDLCAALTGRVPLAGLHRDENRLAKILFEVIPLDRAGLPRDLYFAAIGYVLGRLAAGRVALLEGLPSDTNEDELKSIGSAGASSGALAMFHVLGITPEAPTIDQAFGGASVCRGAAIGQRELNDAVAALCPLSVGEPVAAMCLGTPHFSRDEFTRLATAVSGRRAAPGVEIYISTSRAIAASVSASAEYPALSAFGVKIVVDTCTYVTPGLRMRDGAIVTNSAKYAHYGPSSLRRRVGLMTLERCVRSAEKGCVAAP